MARLNKASPRKPVFTHEGAKAVGGITPVEQLRRTVMSCLLFEDQFYEDGQSIADRIQTYATKVKPEDLSAIAIEARTHHNLRHVPLLLLSALCKTSSAQKNGYLLANTIAEVICRPDELGEFMAIYKKLNNDGKGGLGQRQVKKGLALAFQKFNEYSLSKYNRGKDQVQFTLKDVLFLAHPSPLNKAQQKLWDRLVAGDLKTADTWEVALSAGEDKKETWERLLSEGQLGYFALLRNLRNMSEAGVSTAVINKALRARKGGAEKILPFRFTQAARAAPQFERALDDALCANLETMPALPGKTLILVDVSGSMDKALSSSGRAKPWNSKDQSVYVSKAKPLTRMDAAATLASMINAEEAVVFTFSTQLVQTKGRRGMAGVEEIINSQRHGGTALGAAVREAIKQQPDFDRIIVLSDEQASDIVTNPVKVKSAQRAYMINLASYQNGVGYKGGWTHIDGFSESVLKFVARSEGLAEDQFDVNSDE